MMHGKKYDNPGPIPRRRRALSMASVRRCRTRLANWAAALMIIAIGPSASAGEVWLNAGGGPQPGGDQVNRSAGFDFVVYAHDFSARKSIEIGISYTWLGTDTDFNSSMYAVSIYPQLTFYPTATSRIRDWFPQHSTPFFFVRALGPGYISSNTLGERRQAQHFAFQAQFGAGLIWPLDGERELITAISLKHFSNANLFDPNDGIDLPLMLNLAMRF
jgi:hypothetical protein